METDLYKTISSPTSESIFKDRGSKFIGYAFPIKTEEEAKVHLEAVWQTHNKASHVCYAWQLGKKYEHYRVNDDGEPNNSAGMPIYGQIQSAGITEVLVTVVRYYGGVNLGVGGLINAYRTAAQMTLDSGKIITRSIKITLSIQFEYELMNTVMRIVKEENLKIIEQTLHLDCKIDLAIRQNKLEAIKNRFDAIQKIKVSVLDD